MRDFKNVDVKQIFKEEQKEQEKKEKEKNKSITIIFKLIGEEKE